ncbi:unnamed protein product [Aspergillus oryzae]|uniref:Unnamed protein product n=1 Tax=Aspergillus oryzae TaxID=5062 RepID=A0AAN4YHJ2_ASPOZ|nr:unnamed protein product [Aspergillus oryzae]
MATSDPALVRPRLKTDMLTFIFSSTMEEFEVVNKLTGGLRHLRVREADEVVKYSVPVETVPRPGFNTTGKEVDISLNAYPITKFPSRNVYQYDVSVSGSHSILFDSANGSIQGLISRTGGRTPNAFRLVVRPTKTVNLAVLNAWLQGRAAFGESVLEALKHKDLGNGVLAFKGVYEAIRPAIHLMHELRPVPDGHGGMTESTAFYEVHRRLKKLVVQAHYRGCPCTNVNFTVKGLINAGASKYIIELKDKATGVIEKITVEQYFKRKYNLSLTYPDLPMVEMTKKGIVYPMEYLTIHGLHKYPWKLNEYQTSQMIKYAAARPADRLNSIHKSKKMLDHSKDPVLQTFGLQIDENMIRTKARLLPNPDIQFGGNQRHNPGTNGRWDLRGKKFYQPNKQPLSCWGVGFIPGKRNVINRTQVEHFVDGFMKTYAGHGGNITQRPLIAELTEDTGEAIKRLFNSTGNKFQKEPQLLLIIVPDKNSFTYLRIKKSCDCRWGVPSQVLQSAHVAKANPQYISNVLMKVNAKLGGTTARIIPKVNDASLKPMTMIIGADVTHPTIGVWSPSMAAVSVCMDTFGGRYWGACETNGDRVEVIARANMEHMLTPLVREWMSTVGQGRAPENVYYFRDGVSEGEREKILKQEVLDIKSIFMKLTQDTWKGKFTVVIANKRHHIRAFPRPTDRNAADKNGNPLPGLLIEKDVTSPHDWDFFLYSHIALQGTSRPVHYHVILDQIGHKAHQLENMIYDHCYQYIRSTTSVSLFYYAHLIAARARHHEDVPASSGPRSGREVPMTNPKPKDKPVDPRLLPIHGTPNRLPFAVWYI